MKYEPLFELERTGVQIKYHTNTQIIYPVHWHSAVELIYILNGNAGIMELAERHGFTNYKLFSKMFHEIYGCTPREIRRDSKT